MTHPYLVGTATPRVLAHRGFVDATHAAEGIVENSFAAVAAAQAIGAEYVESDCHLTADGEVVLFHDADLRRVTGDPRVVAGVTVRELEQIMAARGGLITLAQALRSFPDMRFNLDVKADAAAEPVGRLVAGSGERVLVTSFSDARRRAALAAADAAGRGIRPATSAGRGVVLRLLVALALRSDALVQRALDGVDALQLPECLRGVRLVTARLIDAAHRAGVEVHVWTINDPGRMLALCDLGADGIVTDRTDLALAVLR